MAMQPVEWVLVVYYGPEAHRATYGRQVRSNRYTKDYIQLSQKPEFLESVKNLFAVNGEATTSVPLTYMWANGSAPGAFVFNSSDRPHLKWETSLGAPQAWKMSLVSSEDTSETIPGDPSHLDFEAAENELALLASRGAGQPYLMAIKLLDQSRILHLRVYLASPSQDYAFADIQLAPIEIQELVKKTSQRSALAWSNFQSGGVIFDEDLKDILLELNAADDLKLFVDSLDDPTRHALSNYIEQPGYGLFFDSACNHDAWSVPTPVSERILEASQVLMGLLEARYPKRQSDDAAAETYEVSLDEVESYLHQIERQNYEIADSHATIKTRGSAQKAFADVVKSNYGYRCAITNIQTKSFLIASHIVPWSVDQSIRLDPSNGICLSALVDRAFENGYLIIDDDLTIRIDKDRIGEDLNLHNHLVPYEGQKINVPSDNPPKVEYLQRRRNLVASRE
jgi:hypothetical protein